jgi:phage gpG-like protein
MNATVTITGADTLMKRLDSVKALGRNMEPVFINVSDKFQEIPSKAIQQQRDPVTGAPWPRNAPITMAARPGGGEGGKRLFDTGKLLQSFRAGFRTSSTEMKMGSNKPQAAILNRGGRITASKTRFLWFPMNSEAKRAGSAHRWWEQAKDRGLDPFFFVSKKGNHILAYMKGQKRGVRAPQYGQKRGKGSKPGVLTPMFLGRKYVVLKPTPYLGFPVQFIRSLRNETAKQIRGGGS